MYYVNYPTCFPSFIQFMQSYGKYNNVQKFFRFFVDYRRVWHPAIPSEIKRRQNSNKFWRLTVCRKRA